MSLQMLKSTCKLSNVFNTPLPQVEYGDKILMLSQALRYQHIHITRLLNLSLPSVSTRQQLMTNVLSCICWIYFTCDTVSPSFLTCYMCWLGQWFNQQLVSANFAMGNDLITTQSSHQLQCHLQYSGPLWYSSSIFLPSVLHTLLWIHLPHLLWNHFVAKWHWHLGRFRRYLRTNQTLANVSSELTLLYHDILKC